MILEYGTVHHKQYSSGFLLRTQVTLSIQRSR